MSDTQWWNLQILDGALHFINQNGIGRVDFSVGTVCGDEISGQKAQTTQEGIATQSWFQFASE